MNSDAISPLDAATARAYCRATLPRVSRTFALNIRLLSGPLGESVRLGYLLCRIADTVEDSPHLAAAVKPGLLAEYATLLSPGDATLGRVQVWSEPFQALVDRGADHALCAHAAHVFRALAELPLEYRQPVEDCVREMTLGMQRFALRRAADPATRLRLETLAELEEYCHVVAGTVGIMLCRLFAVSSPSLDLVRLEQMRGLADRFGLAMQLTNIVQDVAEDARRGAFYVPRTLAARYRIEPEDILDPGSRPAARAVVRELVALAASALDAAVAFTLLIPRREPRLRLFCLWPIFLAARTLRRVLEDERPFSLGSRPRLERAELRRWLGATTLVALSNRAVRRLYSRARPSLGSPA